MTIELHHARRVRLCPCGRVIPRGALYARVGPKIECQACVKKLLKKRMR